MIAGLTRAWDNLLGRGDAAVTVPPLDGALRPNRLLDEADWRLALPGVDNLVVVSGQLMASAGDAVYLLEGETWQRRNTYQAELACIAALGDDGLVAALVSGDIVIDGGPFDGRTYRVADDVRCITAMSVSGTNLFVANGSATHGPNEWQRDLLESGCTGSIWRIDLESGNSAQIASGLGYPAGLIVDQDRLVFSEAWEHRLVSISASGADGQDVLYSEISGYPGRITTADGGFWLAAFAPRSQIVEFVLREPGYRKAMVRDVPRDFWIAPKLRSGRSFYEPLQGGGVKHLGLLKPWSPTMSAGLAIKLDADFLPRLSLHSRADGNTHGITSLIEHQGRVYAAARGDGVVVSIGLGDLGGEQ